MADDANHEALAAFMSITGAEHASATQFLDLTNWNLDEAVNLFMESGGHGFGGGSSDSAMAGMPPPPAPAAGGAYGYADGDVRAPDPSKRQRLVGASFDNMPLRRIHDQYRDFAAESIAAINAAADAPNIASAFGPGVDDGASRTRDLSTLFQPPVEIMFQGSYADARMHAKHESKWLLVNIQDEIVFASHMLNRDTWSDDVVQNLVASGFVFWQNYWASEHGKKFCTLYQIEREKLPTIVIIDPRTGEIVQRWDGFLEPQDLTEKLSDFCCMHTMDAPLPTASAATDAAQPLRTIDDASEDDQLAAAIAASLQNGSDDSDMEETKHDDDIDVDVDDEVFETLEPEPADGTPDATRVQIRTPDGSRLTRRFLKTDSIAKLWVFVKEQVPEARSRSFELRTAFPPAAVAFSDSATFADKGLANANLMVKWV